MGVVLHGIDHLRALSDCRSFGRSVGRFFQRRRFRCFIASCCCLPACRCYYCCCLFIFFAYSALFCMSVRYTRSLIVYIFAKLAFFFNLKYSTHTKMDNSIGKARTAATSYTYRFYAYHIYCALM